MGTVVIGKGKAVHTLTETGLTACKRETANATEVHAEVTCKACLKMATIAAHEIETLFTLASVTEVSAHCDESAEVVATETVVSDETETETDETETGPSDAEIFRMMGAAEIAETVLTGYSVSEWTDVMLSTDTHNLDMSRGIAVERLFMTKQAARKAKRLAAETARAERAARMAQAVEHAETSRASDAYRAMSDLMGELRTRGVVMTLTGDTVKVESLTWVKGEGDTLETVATFTVSGELIAVDIAGDLHTGNHAETWALMLDILPERSADLMPRKYRDVMRTHRHKNSTPGDVTGNRAARNLDGTETATLTSADLTAYAATLESRAADVAGKRTSGKVSMQGVKLTESERRESDRARQAAYRAAKRARALADSMAKFVA